MVMHIHNTTLQKQDNLGQHWFFEKTSYNSRYADILVYTTTRNTTTLVTYTLHWFSTDDIALDISGNNRMANNEKLVMWMGNCPLEKYREVGISTCLKSGNISKSSTHCLDLFFFYLSPVQENKNSLTLSLHNLVRTRTTPTCPSQVHSTKQFMDSGVTVLFVLVE